MTVFEVRRAAERDAETLTEVMSAAFMSDPVSCWIFPDQDERARLHPAFFRIFVDLALAEGEVYTTEGFHGVALWLPVDVAAQSAPDPDFAELFVKHCGEHANRFFVLDELMSQRHPRHESHSYLAFLATAPGWQGRGVGGALLADRLRDLDVAASPAYLEASSPRNAALYSRLGFAAMGPGLTLPDDGPTLIPMWRPPAA